jgi:hypothetical protein
MVYEEKAKLLVVRAKGLDDDQMAFIDFASVKLGILLLKEIIALYRQCKKTPAQATKEMRKPGFFARRRLKKLVAGQQLPEGVTPKEMVKAVLAVGAGTTEDEVAEMFAA